MAGGRWHVTNSNTIAHTSYASCGSRFRGPCIDGLRTSPRRRPYTQVDHADGLNRFVRPMPQLFLHRYAREQFPASLAWVGHTNCLPKKTYRMPPIIEMLHVTHSLSQDAVYCVDGITSPCHGLAIPCSGRARWPSGFPGCPNFPDRQFVTSPRQQRAQVRPGRRL